MSAHEKTASAHAMNPACQRSTLGVVAISQNEEVDLPGFLEHLLPWVHEIVIVDDGSTDRTREIAKSRGAKVHLLHHPRQSDTGFAGQRNFGIEAARSDWLLHMDIDERITPDLMKEILETINDPAYDGYRYRRLNFFLHRPMRGGGWQNWNRVQLGRRGKHHFQNPVHEACIVDGPVGQLRGSMWHLNDADYVERIRKNMVYMQMEAEKLRNEKLHIRWFHFLLHPFWRVFKAYVIDGGFKDGVLGLIYAMYVLTGTFNWYATAWDRSNLISRADLEKRLKDLWLQKGMKPL